MIAERNELVFAKELEEIQKTNDLADQIIIKAREANTANKEQTATPKNEFVERLKAQMPQRKRAKNRSTTAGADSRTSRTNGTKARH